MATRFGARSTGNRTGIEPQLLIKLAVGSVASLIFLLMGILVWSLSGEDSNRLGSPAPAQASIPTTTPVAVLVAAKRIESGSAISPEAVHERQLDPADLTPGTIFARDRNSIIGMFAKTLIKPGFPITSEDLSPIEPVSSLQIPARFRAITVEVDLRGAVEGYTKPNTRVDVLWTYPDKDCGKALRTLVRFSRVLSLGGQTNPNATPNLTAARTTATLLVTERDAKKIELARQMGTLSLTLVGDQEVPTTDAEETVTCDTLRDTKKTQHFAGKMEIVDAETGKLKRWVFDGEQWKEDASNS